MTGKTGPELHDRATRGDLLTPEEQEELNTWYGALDRAEAETLEPEVGAAGKSLAAMIDAALLRITEVSQRIRQLDEETRAVQRENAVLRLQLAQRASKQSV